MHATCPGLDMPSARLAARQHARKHSVGAALAVAVAHRTPQAVLMHPRGARDVIAVVPEQRWVQAQHVFACIPLVRALP